MGYVLSNIFFFPRFGFSLDLPTASIYCSIQPLYLTEANRNCKHCEDDLFEDRTCPISFNNINCVKDNVRFSLEVLEIRYTH